MFQGIRVILMLAFCLFCMTAINADAEPVTVAVASNFTRVGQDIVASFATESGQTVQAFACPGDLSFMGAGHVHPGGYRHGGLWIGFFHDPILTVCWRRERAGSPAPGFAAAGWRVWTVSAAVRV